MVLLFQFPRCQEAWKEIAQLLEERWNFPHSLGEVDGEHIDIISPAGSRSAFFSYNGKQYVFF